jgi:disulfide bond formation protein DsbB
MTDRVDDSLNTELFLPVILGLLLLIGAAGGVWFSQLRPSIAGETSEAAAAAGSSSLAQAAEVAGDAAASRGHPAAGQTKFVATCAACHGPEGQGIAGLGKDMTASEFIAGHTDQELVEFIKAGRDPSDPLNTTGVGMPAKGGNPALTDEDLFDIVAFIRSLRQD